MLGADVAIGRAELGMAEVVAYEHWICDAREDASRGVTQTVELHPANPATSQPR